MMMLILYTIKSLSCRAYNTTYNRRQSNFGTISFACNFVVVFGRFVTGMLKYESTWKNGCNNISFQLSIVSHLLDVRAFLI